MKLETGKPIMFKKLKDELPQNLSYQSVSLINDLIATEPIDKFYNIKSEKFMLI